MKLTKQFSTGIAQINVSEAGDNQIVIIGGANSQLSIEDINFAKQDIEEASLIVCQLETSWQVAVRAMELCKGVDL